MIYKKSLSNKKGLSAVVTTLILVLLVIVAIALVWGVVQNLLTSNEDSIDVNARCLGTTVKATNVNCKTTGGCSNLTLERQGTDDAPIGGVRMVFDDDAGKTVVEYTGDISYLGSKFVNDTFVAASTKKLSDVEDNPTSVETIVFFVSESGQEVACQSGLKSDFTATTTP